jgi:hypothetical protein
MKMIFTTLTLTSACFLLFHVNASGQAPPANIDVLFGDIDETPDASEPAPAELDDIFGEEPTEPADPAEPPADPVIPPADPVEPLADPVVPPADPLEPGVPDTTITPPPSVDPPLEGELPKDPPTEDDSPSDVPSPRPEPRAVPMAPAIAKSKAIREDFTNVYDTGRIISFAGPVLGGRILPMEGDQSAVMLRVQAGGTMVDVFLGPGDFLSYYEVKPGIANSIYISGTLVDMDVIERDQYSGRNLLVADTIRFRGTEVKLRRRDGWPMWRPVPPEDE